MRKTIFVWQVVALLACSAQEVVFAQTSGMDDAAGQRVPLMAGGAIAPQIVSRPDVELQIAPRFWYLFASAGVSAPASLRPSTNNDFEFPMAGASASLKFATLPLTDFVITGLYGTSASRNTFANVGSPTSSVTDTSIRVHRYDAELLAQTAIPNSSWAWIVGGRLEHDSAATSSRARIIAPTGISTFLSNLNYASDIITAKGGLAGAVPLTNDLRLFGNIMGIAGVSTSRFITTGTLGPDFSIGLQYVFSPNVIFDMRYRAIVFFYTNTKPGNTDYAINQGPMLGLNIKF